MTPPKLCPLHACSLYEESITLRQYTLTQPHHRVKLITWHAVKHRATDPWAVGSPCSFKTAIDRNHALPLDYRHLTHVIRVSMPYAVPWKV